MATAPDTRLLGKSIKRREDPRFITGRGSYTDDLKLPGMTYAAFVRSPHAHAKIRNIDLTQAKAHPGVVAIFTGKDLTGVNSLPCGWLLPELKVPPHPPLAVDTARYVGDPVAVVIAESQDAALDAAEKVKVDWDVRPAVFSPACAGRRSDVPLRHAVERRLRDGRHPLIRVRRVHQHHAGRRLPWRGPTRGRLSAGAHDRGGRRRTQDGRRRDPQ